MPLQRSITAVTCGRFPKCSPAHLPSSLRRHNTVSRLRQHRARLSRVRCCFFMFSVDICTDCIFSASNIQHFVHNSQSYCRLFFLSLRIFDMYRQFGFSSDDITNVKIMSTIHAHEFAERKPGFFLSIPVFRQTAVNFLPVLPHCTKFCRRKSRRVEQENTGWNSRKRCAIICPQTKAACNMMKNKKKEGLFP